MKKFRVLSFWFRVTVVFHLAFWAVVYIILVRHFSISSELKGIDYLFGGLFQVAVMLPVYVNLFLLLPFLFKRKKYLLYLLGLAVDAALFLGFHGFVFEKLTHWLFPSYYIIGYYDVSLLIVYFLIFVGVTTLIQLSQSWFELVEQERRIQRLEVEKARSALQALKAQINPHFLFNSLNSLYALSLRKADELPEVTLKLADVLRYMIYEANESLVPLQKEVDFLQKYLDLQRLRLQPQTEVRFEVSGDIDRLKVAPLLFIVFVENAFKHSGKAAGKGAFVSIQLEAKADNIHFRIENSKGPTDIVRDEKASGLGLDNVRQRLDMLYPGHVLLIGDEAECFVVDLWVGEERGENREARIERRE